MTQAVHALSLSPLAREAAARMGAILPGPERDRAREAELMAELFGGIARERRGLDDEPP